MEHRPLPSHHQLLIHKLLIMPSHPRLPEFVLFGDSLTEWSFDETTQGFGLYLEEKYAGKASMVNEGMFLNFIAIRNAV